MEFGKIKSIAIGVLALGSVAVWADAAVAAAPEKPRDEKCTKWVLKSPPVGNWEGAPKEKWWQCVAGDLKGATKSASVRVVSAADPGVDPGPGPGPGPGPDPVYAGNSDNLKGNNGIGTGDRNDAGNPPGGGNTGNDRN